MKCKVLFAVGGAIALSACATSGSTDRVASASEADDTPTYVAKTESEDPFASTYSAYPGEETLIIPVTVFDGAGGKWENGWVHFKDGEIAAVGGPSTSTLTLATLPIQVLPHTMMVTKQHRQPRRMCGPNTQFGPRTLGLAGLSPTAASPPCKSCPVLPT